MIVPQRRTAETTLSVVLYAYESIRLQQIQFSQNRPSLEEPQLA